MIFIFYSCFFILICLLYWIIEINNIVLEYLSGRKLVFIYEDFMVLYKSVGIFNFRFMCGKKKNFFIKFGWVDIFFRLS